jgi:succinate dehydrogenase hydrophobic anchor subunit
MTEDQYVVWGIVTVVLAFAELGMETISADTHTGRRWAALPRWAARGAVLCCLLWFTLATVAGGMG